METKKNPKLELSNYSFLFFSIGLTLSLGLVIAVFELKTSIPSSSVSLADNVVPFEEVLDVPLTMQASPPPPKISTPKIIEVPDDEIVDVELSIDFDIAEEPQIEELIIAEEPEEEIADEVFSVVEEMPSFPGGNAQFYEFISSNLKYPRKALKANVEGKVIVRFVVTPQGDISDIEVLKGIGFDCDEEAVRVLQTSPNWIPGKQNGKKVNVRIMLPLTFNI